MTLFQFWPSELAKLQGLSDADVKIGVSFITFTSKVAFAMVELQPTVPEIRS